VLEDASRVLFDMISFMPHIKELNIFPVMANIALTWKRVISILPTTKKKFISNKITLEEKYNVPKHARSISVITGRASPSDEAATPFGYAGFDALLV
jgi:3-polyprenyl-4-hydroxybenzoate decarboxylase